MRIKWTSNIIWIDHIIKSWWMLHLRIIIKKERKLNQEKCQTTLSSNCLPLNNLVIHLNLFITITWRPKSFQPQFQCKSNPHKVLHQSSSKGSVAASSMNESIKNKINSQNTTVRKIMR